MCVRIIPFNNSLLEPEYLEKFILFYVSNSASMA